MTLIKNALDNIKSHKLRMFITIFWIIIGITSVVVVSSIGAGFKEEIKKTTAQIDTKSTTILFEFNQKEMEGYSAFFKPFTSTDLNEIALLEGVQSVKSSNENHFMDDLYSSSASFDKKTSHINIFSFDTKKDKLEENIVYGRDISLDDEFRKVILLSMSSATELFESPSNAIGCGITIDNETFEVIGILSEEQNLDSKETSKKDAMTFKALMPKLTFENFVARHNYSNQQIYSINIITSTGFDTYEICNNVIDKLNELHPFSDGSYYIQDIDTNNNHLNNIITGINKFVAIVTAISLFVGGIGIMNIMYVCVIERKREIGIRRALGAKRRTIIFQFLVEAIFITFIGGLLGSIVGVISTNYIATTIPFKPILTFSGFLYALLTSILTGVIFGIVPAIKASNIDPIKAISGS